MTTPIRALFEPPCASPPSRSSARAFRGSGTSPGWVFSGLPLLTGLLAALGTCLTSPTATAQQANAADRALRDVEVRESVTVREAELFVRVLGRRRPVEELEADDFRVFLAGEELEVISFEEMSLERARRSRDRQADRDADEDLVPEVEPGRTLLVVFETLFTPREFVAESVRSVRRTLDQLAAGDRVALTILGSRAVLVQPFTTDREVLRAALDFIEGTVSAAPARARRAAARLAELNGDAPLDARRAAVELGLRGTLALSTELGGSLASIADSSLDPTVLSPYRFGDGIGTFDQAAQSEINSTANAAGDANRALGDLARLLSDVPPPRYAWLMSRGLPTFTKTILDGLGSGDPSISRSGAGSALLASYQGLAYVLEGHGWVVQAFDVTGIAGRSTGFTMEDSAPRQPLSPDEMAAYPEAHLRGGLVDDGSDGLFFLAHETGGELFDNFNRIEVATRKALEQTSHHYRLVVRLPDDPDLFDKRRHRTLEVRVSDLPAGTRVTSSMAADWSLPRNLRSTDRAHLARAELLGEIATDHLAPQLARLSVFRSPGPDGVRFQRAVVMLSASKTAIAPASTIRNGRAGVLVHAIALPSSTEPGAGVEFLDLWTADAEWSAREMNPSQDLVVLGDLLIPCEGALIRVRLADAEQIASWTFEESLDDACAGLQPLLWSPRRETGNLTWVLEEGFDPDDRRQSPWLVDGESMLPDLRATVVSGDSLPLVVRAHGASSPTTTAESSVTFRDLGSGEVHRRDLPLNAAPARGEGVARGAVRVDLPAGSYAMRLGAEAPTGQGPIVTVFGDGSP